MTKCIKKLTDDFIETCNTCINQFYNKKSNNNADK
jgi:hypothetical protein